MPKKALNSNALKWCWLSLLIIILDQLTKYWVVSTFVLYESLPVFPHFNLTLLYNTGAAFSFLGEYPAIAVWLFSGIAILVSVVILIWLKKLSPQKKWMACGLALVLGGGIGNLIDRVYYGYVVDFLDFYWGAAHFPAFNVADSAISVGAAMIFLNLVTTKEE